MIKSSMPVIFTGFALISGCDLKDDIDVFVNEQPVPASVLNAGVELQIGPDQKATVFGPDMCETGFEDDDPSDDIPGCTLLSGRDAVEVTLVAGDDQPLKEVWVVSEGVGPSNKGISITRPNGWAVREPSE